LNPEQPDQVLALRLEQAPERREVLDFDHPSRLNA
jgi:hypothetical protein